MPLTRAPISVVLLVIVSSCGSCDGPQSQPPCTPHVESGVATVDEPTLAFGGRWGCARTDDGGVACWSIERGGDAIRIAGVERVRTIAVGASSRFAILDDGTLWHWAELGPARAIEGGQRMVSVDASGSNACALDVDGHVYCWSLDLGEGSAPPKVAAALRGVPPLVEVAVSVGHACGRDRDGGVWCWGSNHVGQLGDGTVEARDEPVRVQLPSAAIDIDAGEYAACAVLRDGSLSCWGSPIGLDGPALGCSSRYEMRAADPAQVWSCPRPYRVSSMSDLVSVDLGSGSALGTRRDGKVVLWPANPDDHAIELRGASSLRARASALWIGVVVCGWTVDGQLACVRHPFAGPGSSPAPLSWVVRLAPSPAPSSATWSLGCPAGVARFEHEDTDANAELLDDGGVHVRIIDSASTTVISERVVPGPTPWLTRHGAECRAMGFAGASLAVGGGVLVELSVGDECSENTLCAHIDLR